MLLILAQDWCSVKCTIAFPLSELSVFKGLRGPPGPKIFLGSPSEDRSLVWSVPARVRRRVAPRFGSRRSSQEHYNDGSGFCQAIIQRARNMLEKRIHSTTPIAPACAPHGRLRFGRASQARLVVRASSRLITPFLTSALQRAAMIASRGAPADPAQRPGLMLDAVAAAFLGTMMNNEGNPRVRPRRRLRCARSLPACSTFAPASAFLVGGVGLSAKRNWPSHRVS
jgi:hypothetical protein